MAFILRIEGGPGAGREVPFAGPSLTIGRQAGCDLVLPDGQLSRRHARLDLTPGGVTIADLGSANGTRVNGDPLVAPAPLRAGDVIQLGDSAIRLLDAGEGVAAGPGAAVPPASSPVPPPSAARRAGRGRPALPVLVGGVVALLLLCACAGVGAIALASRGGSPTATAAPQLANGRAPTATAVRSEAGAPTATAGTTSTRPAAASSGAAPARPATGGGGTFRGTVKGGYEITFALSADGKTISAVQARVLSRCNDKSSSEETIFLPPASFPVASDGTFRGEGRYQDGGPTYAFAGQLRGDTASGTLKEESALAGTICTTYQLTWEATRQNP